MGRLQIRPTILSTFVAVTATVASGCGSGATTEPAASQVPTSAEPSAAITQAPSTTGQSAADQSLPTEQAAANLFALQQSADNAADYDGNGAVGEGPCPIFDAVEPPEKIDRGDGSSTSFRGAWGYDRGQVLCYTTLAGSGDNAVVVGVFSMLTPESFDDFRPESGIFGPQKETLGGILETACQPPPEDGETPHEYCIPVWTAGDLSVVAVPATLGEETEREHLEAWLIGLLPDLVVGTAGFDPTTVTFSSELGAGSENGDGSSTVEQE